MRSEQTVDASTASRSVRPTPRHFGQDLWEKSVKYELKRDGTVAVAPDAFWVPVTDPSTPRGVTVWVINREHGVATRGQITPESPWTHWFPLPKFKD